MDELIILFKPDEPDKPIPHERWDFYERRYRDFVGYHCAMIDVFLFNRHGELLFQKRGRDKKINPSKLHTSFGGHINHGEDAAFTLIHECIEELGVAPIVLPPERFEAAYAMLGDHTDKAALLLGQGDHFLDYPRPEGGNIQDRIWFYFGRYDGPLQNPDRSFAGFEWMNLDTYRKLAAENPSQFTFPLRVYMEKFLPKMEKFVAKYCRR